MALVRNLRATIFVDARGYARDNDLRKLMRGDVEGRSQTLSSKAESAVRSSVKTDPDAHTVFWASNEKARSIQWIECVVRTVVSRKAM